MSRHDVAILTLRAFALYAWFQALEFIASGAVGVILATSIQTEAGLSFGKAVMAFGPSAVFLAVGAFLFAGSRVLASWLLPPPSDSSTREELSPQPLLYASVAFAAIGIAFLLRAVPGAISYGIIVSSTSAPTRALRGSEELPQVIGIAAQMGLGFLLFLNARAFATTWWRKQQPKAGERNA